VKFLAKAACSCLDTTSIGHFMFLWFHVDPSAHPSKVEIRIKNKQVESDN